MFRRYFLYFNFLLVLCFNLEAKSDSTVQRYIVGSFATNSFRGDLSSRYRIWLPGWQVGVKFNRKKALNGTFQFGVGRVEAERLNLIFTSKELPKPEPVNYVSTGFFTLGYDLQLNFYRSRRILTYASFGFHLIRFNPKDIDGKSLSGEDRNRTREKGETYGNISSCFPTLIGFSYFFTNQVGIGVQAGWINQSTGYMDNMKQLGESNRRDNVATFRIQVFSALRQTKKR